MMCAARNILTNENQMSTIQIDQASPAALMAQALAFTLALMISDFLERVDLLRA